MYRGEMRKHIWGYAILKARQGLFAEAIQFGEAGLRETEKVNDGWLSGLIRIGLSIVHYYAGNYKESTNHSLEANKLFKECGDTLRRNGYIILADDCL